MTLANTKIKLPSYTICSHFESMQFHGMENNDGALFQQNNGTLNSNRKKQIKKTFGK